MDSQHRVLLSELVEALKRKYGGRLVSVVVFGSVARGESGKNSDVDVIVVIESLPKSKLRRQEEFISVEEIIEKKMGEDVLVKLSPIIKTPEEVRKIPPILLDVVEDGIILYDRDNFFGEIVEKLRRELNKLGSRRVRVGKRWYWVLKPDYRFGEVINIE